MEKKPKVFIKDGERFVKIKVAFELEVFVGEIDEEDDEPAPMPEINMDDVEQGIENMDLTSLGEALLDNIDFDNTILDNVTKQQIS